MIQSSNAVHLISQSLTQATFAGNSNFVRLEKIREIASLVNSGKNVGTIFERIVAAVCHHTLWNNSGIMTVDRATGFSVLVASYGARHRGAQDDIAQQWELATSPCLKVVTTNQPIIIENAQINDEFPGYRADSIAYDYRTVVLLPLGCTDLHGQDMVLDVCSENCISVPTDELDFLITISHLAGLAVDKGKSLQSERTQSSRLERMLEANSGLLDRVLHGNAMDAIVGIVKTILPDPAVIVDLTTDSFHVTNSPSVMDFGDSEWAEFVRGPAARQIVQTLLQTKPSDFRLQTSLRLETTDQILTFDVYVEALLNEGEIVGGLILFPLQKQSDKLDFLTNMQVKFALSAQLMRTHIQQQSNDNQMTELFKLLLDGGWQKDEQIHIRAARLGLDLSQPAQLLVVDLPGRSTSVHSDRPYPAPRTLKRSLAQSFPNAVLVYHNGALVIYLPVLTKHENAQTVRSAQQLVNAVKWYFDVDLIFTLSAPCAHLQDYKLARKHCAKMLSLGRSFGRKDFVLQEDFGPFAFLLSGLDPATSLTFIHQTIGQIEAYDRENQTELLQTAETFIEQGCRYQATAVALRIHVSTLRYRLVRLKETFGMDLEKEESRFTVSLAIKLRYLLKNAADA